MLHRTTADKLIDVCSPKSQFEEQNLSMSTGLSVSSSSIPNWWISKSYSCGLPIEEDWIHRLLSSSNCSSSLQSSWRCLHNYKKSKNGKHSTHRSQSHQYKNICSKIGLKIPLFHEDLLFWLAPKADSLTEDIAVLFKHFLW